MHSGNKRTPPNIRLALIVIISLLTCVSGNLITDSVFKPWYSSLGLLDKILLNVAIFVIVVGLERLTRQTRSSAEDENDQDELARRVYLNYLKKYLSNRYENAISRARYITPDLKDSHNMIGTFFFINRNSGGEEKTVDSLEEFTSKEVFRILLLGDPGSGKTTTLYKSVLDFIAIASQDNGAILPLYINLAGWDNKQADPDGANFKRPIITDFEAWLATAVVSSASSNIPEAVVIKWLKSQRVCLFMDGLDEAAEDVRAVLVSSINIFLEKRPNIPALICSRKAD